MDKPSKLIVYSILILIQLLFGINFATSKVVVGVLDPFVWSNIRFLIAGVIMLSITLILKRPHPKRNTEFFLPLVPLSLLGMALGQGLFLFGLKLTSSVNTAIITSTIPLITMIIVVLRGQEKLTLSKCIGFVVAFLGVFFIKDLAGVNFTIDTVKGDLLVLSGALCFALYLSYGKKYLMSFDNMWVTSYMFLISAAMMFIINIIMGNSFDLNQSFSADFILCGSYTIIGATLLTYFLNNWALRRAASGNVALFIYLQPVVAGVIGYLFLDEIITTRMIICSILIIFGVLITLKKRKNNGVNK